VTHPFHPLGGREFELLDLRQTWGERRVYFHDDDGRFVAMPVGWTDAEAADPFVLVAAGRSYFRMEDLVRLAELVEMLKR